LVWRSRSDAGWLMSGACSRKVRPFTATAILLTNKKLLDPETADDPELAERLLARWGSLHALRGVLS